MLNPTVPTTSTEWVFDDSEFLQIFGDYSVIIASDAQEYMVDLTEETAADDGQEEFIVALDFWADDELLTTPSSMKFTNITKPMT